ncbi:MAG: hypothetical protein ABS06_02530 [Methylophilales bacterium BACL14 MAG-120910-bin43]|jgi:competence CoiA-like predicted nuclease|nr:MAG: hypothetical protein ABS06_02530 [Methylophilales bacterium BACL14 MAG-120910-bin43]KRP07262.1 MAG: hypothetical protein ABS29_01610 [Methylophilales bacterium BACL14 MAG-120920-bin58]
MHKIILLLLIHVLSAQADAFGDFAKTNFFSEIDPSFLQLTAECRKNFDEKNNKKAFEILFYSKGKHVFDLNKHYSSHHEGHKNLKTPFYSITFWNWFNAIAIETESQQFVSNTTQKTMRRNELIPQELFDDIVTTGTFRVYFHYLMDNAKSMGEFTIGNSDDVRSCFR